MRQDPARLTELRRLMLLDSAPDRDYDAIANLLASSLDVPIVIVNLLDEQRDWFKACVGLPLTESPAATSFCEAFFHAPDDLIVVPDTTCDARFSAHPLVTGAPQIRFYAAARLAVGGQTMGTLCAYDMKPRQIAAGQIAQLQALAAQTVDLLHKRAAGAAAGPA